MLISDVIGTRPKLKLNLQHGIDELLVCSKLYEDDYEPILDQPWQIKPQALLPKVTGPVLFCDIQLQKSISLFASHKCGLSSSLTFCTIRDVIQSLNYQVAKPKPYNIGYYLYDQEMLKVVNID